MADKDIVHLCEASKALPDTSSYLNVKNHFLWSCHAKQGRLLDKESSICPNCMHQWSAGKFSFRLEQDVTPGPRMSKILRKHSRSPDSLNVVENKLMLRHLQRKGNKIIFNCHVCRKSTSVPLKKPAVLKLVKEDKDCQPEEQSYSCKKKKKRDRFVGLNISAVLSAAPSPLPKIKNLKKNPGQSYLELKGSKMAKPSLSVPQTSMSSEGLQYNLNSKNIVTWKKTVNTTVENLQNSDKSVQNSLSVRDKMRKLREEQRNKDHQAVVKEKLGAKRNDRLKNFFNTQDKTIELNDRIQSLLQL